MQAIIDLKQGDYFRCLLENGDVVNVHKTELSKDVDVDDIIKISFTKDKKASARQKELKQK